MRIMTVLGTRPEIIRLSLIIPKLDRLGNHVLVHTGQNYAHTLNDIFFSDLRLRTPDYVITSKSGSPMAQIGTILVECEKIMLKEKPDRLLILGDTNSALSAIAAKRIGIPVFHMEAGNRCYDDRVPEEVNRRIIDNCSDILMPYTERSRANLLREGVPGHRVYVTGNPINEVLYHFAGEIGCSNVLTRMSAEPGAYFLVTLHRSENVDIKERLVKFVRAFRRLFQEYGFPVLCSLHPRTCYQLNRWGIKMDGDGIRAFKPLGLFDFIHLEKNAFCVLTDSGTVQEECCIFGVPNVTIRDVTERPETVEAGSSLVAGCDLNSIVQAVQIVVSEPGDWQVPGEYLVKNVSRTVIKIVTGEHYGL